MGQGVNILERMEAKMHVVIARSAFDLPAPQWDITWMAETVQSVAPALHAAARAIGVAAQCLAFAAIMWIVLAAPGFLSAQDSHLAAQARPGVQASR